MINNIYYTETNSVNPHHNLALEEHLFFKCEEDEVFLYLWQNSNTIVIGKNQNAWKECNLSRLERDGGVLVRRMSGGGAVYHDMGNLNFTFICHKENYDVDRQLEVIIRALSEFGICAEKTGRNDITVNGRKISGNAFYERGNRCYHHGTIMVDVDVKKLTQYLNVSKEKLQSKGIDSVKSRVSNLIDFASDITVEVLKDKLFEMFEAVYGRSVRQVQMDEQEQDEIHELTEKYASWDWTFGRKIDFQYELSNLFSWGQLTLQIKVSGGYIKDIGVFSDSMDPEIASYLLKRLKYTKYDRTVICSNLRSYAYCSERDIYSISEKQMIEDIAQWIEGVEL